MATPRSDAPASTIVAVDDLPAPVDLALIIVPAPQVAQTLAAVGRCGIHAAIILSGGFRETGPAGAALEEECLRVAREHNIRLIGPNCIGLVNTHLVGCFRRNAAG